MTSCQTQLQHQMASKRQTEASEGSDVPDDGKHHDLSMVTTASIVVVRLRPMPCETISADPAPKTKTTRCHYVCPVYIGAYVEVRQHQFIQQELSQKLQHPHVERLPRKDGKLCKGTSPFQVFKSLEATAYVLPGITQLSHCTPNATRQGL